MATETISKLVAARRHMNVAICLFFDRRDLLAVHSLAAASAQVLSDLCSARGLVSPLRGGDFIRPERRKEWISVLKGPENFLKHANHDPEAELNLDSRHTEIVLFDATCMYFRLVGELTFEAKVFQIWFLLGNPDLLADCPGKRLIESYRASGVFYPNNLALFARFLTGGPEGQALAAVTVGFKGLGL